MEGRYTYYLCNVGCKKHWKGGLLIGRNPDIRHCTTGLDLTQPLLTKTSL